MRKYNYYIICLLDLKHDRNQEGIFFLQTTHDFIRVAEIMSVSSIKKLLANRWELHFTKVDSKRHYASTHKTVAGVAKKIIEHLREKEKSGGESTTILLPANSPAKE
jgi:hypothetical protein